MVEEIWGFIRRALQLAPAVAKPRAASRQDRRGSKGEESRTRGAAAPRRRRNR
jgi:hypothetical protein